MMTNGSFGRPSRRLEITDDHITAAGCAAVLLACSAFFGLGYTWGQTTSAADATLAVTASAQARQAEQHLAASAAKDTAATQQQNAHAQTDHLLLAQRLHARIERVFIPAACPASGSASGTAEPATQPPRAELAPETASDLDAIATDGDAAIRDLNLCIQRYTAAQTAVSTWAAQSAAQP
jgi:hypothetical protein